MNIALWVLAGVLALIFCAGGTQKLVQPKEKLAASGFDFVEDFSPGTVKMIGVLEILAAIGLIAPATFDIVPVMVPIAAVGLSVLMVGAAVVHGRRGESKAIVVNLAFLTLAVALAIGRFGPESFSA